MSFDTIFGEILDRVCYDDERIIIRALFNCEDFVEYIKKNYELHNNVLTNKWKLIRKRDKKVLVEWLNFVGKYARQDK